MPFSLANAASETQRLVEGNAQTTRQQVSVTLLAVYVEGEKYGLQTIITNFVTHKPCKRRCSISPSCGYGGLGLIHEGGEKR